MLENDLRNTESAWFAVYVVCLEIQEDSSQCNYSLLAAVSQFNNVVLYYDTLMYLNLNAL